MENKIYTHPFFGEMYYLIDIPESLKDKENLPIVLFLHGAGERGKDHKLIKVHGIPKYIENKAVSLPVVTICPQCVHPRTWANSIEFLRDFIEYVIKEHKIDRSRMAITGISMGGYGTWEMIMTFPDYFKKAAPICGGGTVWRACDIKADVWTFHGDIDPVVPVENTTMMADALQKSGKKIKYTLFHNIDHGSWDMAYLDTKVLDWLCDI